MYESVKKLSDSAIKATKKAVKTAKQNNISVTYLSGSKIVREASDGSKVTIGTIKEKNQESLQSKRRFKLV